MTVGQRKNIYQVGQEAITEDLSNPTSVRINSIKPVKTAFVLPVIKAFNFLRKVTHTPRKPATHVGNKNKDVYRIKVLTTLPTTY